MNGVAGDDRVRLSPRMKTEADVHTFPPYWHGYRYTNRWLLKGYLPSYIYFQMYLAAAFSVQCSSF